MDGQYGPVAMEELSEGIIQGCSEGLDLFIRWDHGRLLWPDPATGRPIINLETSEARVRELEEEVRRLRGEHGS